MSFQSNHERPLGNRPPEDDRHVQLYPLKAVGDSMFPPPEEVDRILGEKLWGVNSDLPAWHWTHDQGWVQGSCVGHATTLERAVTNIAQARAAGRKPYNRRYDPLHVWRLAKDRDEWEQTRSDPDNNDGTSARAAYDVLREIGPRRARGTKLGADGKVIVDRPGEPDPSEGIEVNRWAETVDEMRAAFAAGISGICIGTPWMSGFDVPRDKRAGRFTLPLPAAVGRLRGYHETFLYGASDRLGGFLLKNSWGRDYPLVIMPYETMEWCFGEWADAALVTDR